MQPSTAKTELASGSSGEHLLQERLGTQDRAEKFYQRQVLDHLNEAMQTFVARQDMMFVATSDAEGNCDSTLRAGPPGFVVVLDARRIAWPEYRGNGVMASRGNVVENPHVGLLFVDFIRDHIGLHVNGRAMLVDDDDIRLTHPGPAGRHRAGTPTRAMDGRRGAGGVHPLLQAHPSAAPPPGRSPAEPRPGQEERLFRTRSGAVARHLMRDRPRRGARSRTSGRHDRGPDRRPAAGRHVASGTVTSRLVASAHRETLRLRKRHQSRRRRDSRRRNSISTYRNWTPPRVPFLWRRV